MENIKTNSLVKFLFSYCLENKIYNINDLFCNDTGDLFFYIRTCITMNSNIKKYKTFSVKINKSCFYYLYDNRHEIKHLLISKLEKYSNII